MSIRDATHIYLTDARTLRACLYLVAALALALLVVWPRGPLEAALRSGQAPDTFTVVAICFLVSALYLGARFGAEDYSTDPSVQLRELAALTPVSILSLVAGRFAFGVLHTILLMLLGAPFLVAAMAVGGAGVPELLQALGLVGLASLAARMAGFLALAVVGTRRPLRDIVLTSGVTAAAAAAFFLSPAQSSFHALAALVRGHPHVAALPAAANAAAAALLAAAAGGVLAVVRVRARARARGQGGGERG